MIMKKHIVHNFSFFIKKVNIQRTHDEKNIKYQINISLSIDKRELYFLLENEKELMINESEENKFVYNFLFLFQNKKQNKISKSSNEYNM